jgi:hypothetical protein
VRGSFDTGTPTPFSTLCYQHNISGHEVLGIHEGCKLYHDFLAAGVENDGVEFHCQPLKQNSEVYQFNTRKKLDIHIKLQKTEICKYSVINMGTTVCNSLPNFLKETDDYKAFKKELKLFLLLQTFYSVKEFVSS